MDFDRLLLNNSELDFMADNDRSRTPHDAGQQVCQCKCTAKGRKIVRNPMCRSNLRPSRGVSLFFLFKDSNRSLTESLLTSHLFQDSENIRIIRHGHGIRRPSSLTARSHTFSLMSLLLKISISRPMSTLSGGIFQSRGALLLLSGIALLTERIR